MRTIISIVVFAFLLCLPNLSQAQGNYRDIVYLKNGSVIKGIITEQKPMDYIKIETADGNKFVFKPEEIDRIAKEQIAPDDKPLTSDRKKAKFEPSARGPWLSAEAQLLNPPGLGVVLGYKVHRFCYVGVGSGFNNYTGTVFSSGRIFSGTVVPVFARYQGDILKSRVTPTYYVEGGYGFAINKSPFFGGVNETQNGIKQKGGAYAGAGFGVKITTNKKISFGVSLCYKYQRASSMENQLLYDPNTGAEINNTITTKYDMHRFGLKFVFIGFN